MVDGFSCILDFPKLVQNFPGEDPRTPLTKGIHQLNSQNLSSTTTAAKKKKKKKKKSQKALPIKTIYLKFIFRLYRNRKNEEDAGAGSFFAWFVIGLFETLICAIADDKVCDSRIVSSWALLIFLLCLWWWWPNSNFLCCVITQNGESSRDLLLSVTNRKAVPPQTPPPFQKLITLLPVTFSQLDSQLGVLVGGKG